MYMDYIVHVRHEGGDGDGDDDDGFGNKYHLCVK